MREVISLHVGQCGVQIGNACWELFCLEHGIDPNGQMQLNDELDLSSDSDTESNSAHLYFSELESGKFIPRALLVDHDDIVINQVKSGRYKQLFHPSNLITHKEDCSNIFSRAKYTKGREILEQVKDQIRKLVEGCENLDGFMIYHSYGGGTGSGFGSQMLYEIENQYNKKVAIDVGIFSSSDMGHSVVEPYNVLLCMESISSTSDANIIMNNQSLYNICENQMGIDKPSFKEINQLIAQMISSLTFSQRFSGYLNATLAEIVTNTIPYRVTKYLVPSIVWNEQTFENQEKYSSQPSITNLIFTPGHAMANCNLKDEKFLACTLIYKGDISPLEVKQSLLDLKKKKTINFVDWCPTGFNVDFHLPKPDTSSWEGKNDIKQLCCMISNSLAVKTIFQKTYRQFSRLYSKRAFAHWFTSEGMEESEFSKALEYSQALIGSYEDGLKM